MDPVVDTFTGISAKARRFAFFLKVVSGRCSATAR